MSPHYSPFPFMSFRCPFTPPSFSPHCIPFPCISFSLPAFPPFPLHSPTGRRQRAGKDSGIRACDPCCSKALLFVERHQINVRHVLPHPPSRLRITRVPGAGGLGSPLSSFRCPTRRTMLADFMFQACNYLALLFWRMPEKKTTL